FAQEALIKILDNLDSFRGESRFTTWSQKIGVRVAFTELRRKEWRNVSLQEITDRYDTSGHESRAFADSQSSPEDLATQQVMFDTVRRLIYEELTERQREAIVAVMLNGMPLEEAARRMDTNRNALYKLLYDARKRLRKSLISEGITSQDVLAVFGGG
ncbi:MAG: sigma-70 family RNA polymerase sigma factor, partial [Rubrobacteraceae bacterium]